MVNCKKLSLQKHRGVATCLGIKE